MYDFITNEEKANMIAEDFYNAKCCGCPMDNDVVAKQAALEMAKWKDEQFVEMLNALPDSIKNLLKNIV